MTRSVGNAWVPYERHAICSSVEETERLAASFAAHLGPGAFVALSGPLGAGKSVVARAIGAAWGVIEPMPSPTYTIMAIHPGRLTVCHMDLYRLGSSDELEFAGLPSYFDGDGICLVEWAERAHDTWPACGWSVTIEPRGDTERKVVIAPFGHPT